MSNVDYITTMANYNQWMNTKIYSAASQLSTAELTQDRGAFFGSILGTLNHLIVADTLWLKRYANHPANFTALEPIFALEKPTALNQLMFEELAPMQTRRELLDQTIIKMVAAITAVDLTHVLHYSNAKGIAAQKPFAQLLIHFFNHQTHHRGQISTLLFQAGVDVGVTDLITLIPNVE
jgi:uncharacterized damage-inducible protein DinB